ncbi:MAG: tetratricopeptide repeat protein, partial [Gemmatimonadetes bacterium]|nr:tetratricopeptide repeat protein [Gemmatimonadota bacterium]
NRALTLAAGDEHRGPLAASLAALLEFLEADRVAVAWMDDLDPSIPHPHVVVDLLGDRPRRGVVRSVLIDAWESGIPGFVDLPDASDVPGVSGSLVTVALGSDGQRAWFLVVEGPRRGAALSTEQADRLAYTAGELASALLHPKAGPLFPVWMPAAQGDRTGDGYHHWGLRFRLLRLVHGVIAEGLAPDPELLRQRCQGLADEVEVFADSSEGACWSRLLATVGEEGWQALPAVLMEWAGEVASEGELPLAIEICRAAYSSCVLLGDAAAGARAAAQLGQTHRNAGDWDASERSYGRAVAIARSVGDLEREALVLDGWSNTLRVRGRFPDSRVRLREALDVAKRSGSGYAVGSVHHSMMTLAAQCGCHDDALEHGWAAIEGYDTLRDRLRALVTLGGHLLEIGHGDLAERAFEAALEHLQEPYFRLFALDGHAHAAALLGDAALYEERSRVLEREDWRPGGPDFTGQVYLYRGRAWDRLGDRARARIWFERALAWCEEHGLAGTLFAAQAGLDRLDSNEPPEPPGDSLEPATAWTLASRLDRVGSTLAGVS